MSSKSKSPKKILNIDKINKMERNTTEMISKAKSEFVKKINKINFVFKELVREGGINRRSRCQKNMYFQGF